MFNIHTQIVSIILFYRIKPVNVFYSLKKKVFFTFGICEVGTPLIAERHHVSAWELLMPLTNLDSIKTDKTKPGVSIIVSVIFGT